MSTRKPIHEIRYGLIKAAIWQNDVAGATRHSISVIRLYKNGEWKESKVFGRDDLPLVAKVADDAHTWIFKHQRTDT